MKKLFSLITACIMLICAFSFDASAYRIGDTVGYALMTDIVATINGYDIPSYNVDGYTYIVVEDLRYYGFAVNYDEPSRSLSVSRDYSQNWVSKEYVKTPVSPVSVGKRAHALLYTDIKTYLDGYYTHSYNINGQTIIRFDALSAYGGVSYDNNKREISLGLSGINYNPYPVDRSKYSLIDGMSSSEKRDLNIFLSNFSEAYYDPSNPYYYSIDEELIDFAFHHAMINSPSKISYSGNYMMIRASDVDTILNKYLGKTVPHKTPAYNEYWSYSGGYFRALAADGESFSNFSIATSMHNNGNGTYIVNFNIYSPENAYYDGVDTSFYSLTVSQANSICDYIKSGTAIVKPKIYNGKNTYELVDYWTN